MSLAFALLPLLPPAHAQEVCDGVDNTGDGLVDALPATRGPVVSLGDADLVHAGAFGVHAGHGLATLEGRTGQLLAVGQPSRAYPGEVELSDADGVQAMWAGEADGDFSGAELARAGDHTGDGVDELLVTAPRATGFAGPVGTFEGVVYVVDGSVSGEHDLADAHAVIVGVGTDTGFGWAVAGGGDLNGDGYADVAIGAWRADAGVAPEAGVVGIFYGPLSGHLSSDDADAWLLGEEAADQAGFSVAFAGDTDGDGADELLIGAPGSDLGAIGGGAAYLVSGELAGEVSLADADAVFYGADTESAAGWDVSGAGDVDGDGNADLLIGAPDPTGATGGSAYLVHGPAPSSVDLVAADVVFRSHDALRGFGATLANLGDLDGDGASEIAIGAAWGGRATTSLYTQPAGELAARDAWRTFMQPVARGGVVAITVTDLDGAGSDVLVGVPAHQRYAGAVFSVASADLIDDDLRELLFTDADGDGYADETGAELSCSGASGVMPEPLDGVWDCDDTSSAVFPGAVEVCDGLDNDCDGEADEEAVDAPSWAPDADQDGFAGDGPHTIGCDAPEATVAAGGARDCDDADAARHPDATETCNGVDDDCDGTVDVHASDEATFWPDRDGDGHGAGRGRVGCEAPSDFVGNDDDCDDADSSIHPDATEACNGRDDDCDGEADDGLSSSWYADADGDGFGGGDALEACAAPSGHVAEGTDCDDTDSTVNPLGTETCDGRDEDCDGTADDGLTGTWYVDGDGDGYGDSRTATTTCDAVGLVTNGDDCDDGASDVSPSGVESCDGRDEDCDGTVDDGVGDTWYADVDGDGFGGATSVQACAQPSGHVHSSTDCDDSANDTYPGAAETCDGRDEDCDGDTDEDATETWYTDADGDGFGDGSAPVAVCGGGDGLAPSGDDCDDTDASVSPSGTETCDGRDEDCDGDTDEDGGPDWFADGDGDGYGGGAAVQACSAPTGHVSDGSDCDDGDDGVNPGAAELCDGVDNDCNGDVDDDADDLRMGYVDADGDGHGGYAMAWACSYGAGVEEDPTDCDDGSPSVHPGADETCNGVDDDCDGTADEDALDAATWYVDGDGDGHGDPTTAVVACDAPSGTVSDADDCDDGNRAVHPDAVEDCDGVDEDCDGVIDQGLSLTTWYVDGDGDGFGGDDTVASCLQPSGTTEAAEDCDDADASVHPDAEEVCDDLDNDCDGFIDVTERELEPVASVGLAELSIVGELGRADVGHTVVPAGDLDGDGVEDVLVAAPGAERGLGAVYVFHGPLAGELDLSDADAALVGDTAIGAAGYSVAVGDLDGDGHPDLAIGAPSRRVLDGASWREGAVFVARGPFAGRVDLGAADAIHVAADDSDAAGASVAFVDTDGDGVLELAIGAPTADGGATADGAVYLVHAPLADSELEHADLLIAGPGGSARFGAALTGADLDGDGDDEIVVGAWAAGDDEQGAVYAFDASAGTLSTDDASGSWWGEADDLAGTSVIAVDDIDGDAGEDVLVGGPGRDGAAGVVWQTQGAPSPGDSLDSFPAVLGAPASQLGMAVGAQGDFDGDGVADLALGAPNWTSTSGDEGAGAVHVFLGGLGEASSVDDADLTLEGLGEGHAAGVSTGFVGDLDGDGMDDLAIGATGDDIGGTVSVVFGDLTRDQSMAPTWYVDADSDGWGARELALQACDQPSGYVADAGDCDDDEASLSPSADELCDDVDNDCDAWIDEDDAVDAPSWHTDEDFDGYPGPDTVVQCLAPAGGGPSATDCDDGDATRHPGAIESCNGLDDDCDGEVDTDAVTGRYSFYADSDGDGFGDPEVVSEACLAPSGTVEDGTDCDDADVDVFPGAVERCDGIDNDCSGVVDGDEAVDRGTFYTDGDGDGYGDESSEVRSCEMPSGTTTVGDDCDDADIDVNPGADEQCDGLDNNCDTVVDDETSVDASTWYADTDGDGYGDPDDRSVACDQPSGRLASAGDCDDTDATTHEGADETCDSLDNDCDGTTDEDAPGTELWYFDNDGDYRGDPEVSMWSCEQPEGYRPHGDDCDDDNAAVSPVEPESCDLLDNDCNGLVDDGVGEAWYADADGDGYGDKATTVTQCEAPTGYGSNRSDCDDTDASVHPNADEYCDAIDQDCDGEVDDSHALDASTWYWDKDGDGFGRSSTSTAACAQPDDYVADATDCVDWDAASYPGGTEICDEEDNDCDDLTDEGVDDAPTWYLDADDDGYGTADTSATQCSAPDGYVADEGDCRDDDALAFPGAVDWCGDGVDGDCDGVEPSPCSLDSVSVVEAAPIGVLGTAEAEALGTVVTSAGDLDGDGDDELLVTATGFERAVEGTDWECGAAWQLDGATTGEQLASDIGVKAYGEERFLRMGEQATSLGDLDADGTLDWAVGAMRDNTVGSKSGAVYLFDGQLTGDASVQNAVWLLGASGGDQLGSAVVGPGDVNGDGFDDVLAGAWKSNENGSDSGAAYLVLGPITADVDVSGADAILTGTGRDDFAAQTAAGPGDVDGDGFADLVIGAQEAGDGGEAYLVLGPVSGTLDLADADTTWSGASGDQLASSVAAAGDLDGDGSRDVLVAAERADDEVLDGGAVYVVTGQSGELASDAWLTLVGTERQAHFGSTVLAAGDLDASGSDDLVVAAGSYNEETGSVYVFFDPSAGTLTADDASGQHIGSALGDRAGASLGSADTDGDGRPELLIGSPGFDGTASDAGGAWALTLEGL